MFKKRFRKRNSPLFSNTSNRVSEITKPDNTSLIVNESDTETDELPKEITSVLSEEDECLIENRNSTSLLKSLTQKNQSTPLRPLNRVWSDDEDTNSSSSSRPAKKNQNSLNQTKNSHYEKVLKECGATSSTENSCFMLSEDQAVFSLKVDHHLRETNNGVDSFVKSLTEAIENPDAFQKLLTHTLTSDECELARGPVQETMIRILLNVDCLQVDLIDVLVKKLGDVILNGDETECSQMVSSILRQFRFLSVRKDMKLADRLFEIIHVASTNIQGEIIFMLPEIIPQVEMEEVSLKLVSMLREESKLTNVIVDAITNLCLNKAVLSEVRQKISTRLEKCPMEFLPSLVQFILNKCEEDETFEVINNFREYLPFTKKHQLMKKATGGERRGDEDTYLKMTFDILKFSAMASKQMVDTWLKIISSTTSSTDFRCLDLMMLVIMHGNLHGRKNQILSLIRNKIKCSVLTETQVIHMFKALTVVVAEYFSTVLEIASALIKSVYPVVANLGAVFYEESFVQFNFYMEQSVVNELMLHVVTGSPCTIDVVLSTLKHICENHKEVLHGHTTSVMNLLNKVSDLGPSQIRILMNIISDLVFYGSAETSRRWHDEMQIFIRKQVASSKVDVSKKGIVAAVTFAKYAGKRQTDDFAEEINQLLALAMGSPGQCDIKRAFFNDEFATTLRESTLRESFLAFWRRKIRQMFVSNLFVKDIDVECEHFSMSLQYSVPVHNDARTRMVLPVVGFVISTNSGKILDVPLTVIPSALKLMWCSEKTLNSSAFSASVIMPEVTVFDNFQNLDDNPKKIIMDCLFVCINYLIECVNAFSVHGALDKALIRLGQVLAVRKIIGQLIRFMREYAPPCSQFHYPVQRIGSSRTEISKKPSKKGKKRKADRSQIPCTDGETGAETSVQNMETDADLIPEKRENQEVEVGYHGYFRQLHLDCLRLLNANLIPLNEETSSQSELGKLDIRTEDVLYLLEDCLRKCEQVLHKPKWIVNSKGKQGFSSPDEMNASLFVSRVLEILPGLLKKMEIWASYCNKLIRDNEEIYDGPGMYPKESQPIKLALTNSLKFLAEVISWSGFEEAKNKSVLQGLLEILSRKETNQSDSCNALIAKKSAEAARYLTNFSKSVLLLTGGVNIVKSVRACFTFSPSNSPRQKLGDLCLEMLQRPWFTVTGLPERGSLYNQHIDFLVKTYFSAVENPLETLRRTSTVVFGEINQLTEKTSSLITMKSVQRCNFSVLYRGMCETLVSASTEALAKCENSSSRLKVWNVIVETMLVLVNIVKSQSSRVNLAVLLKRCQSMIQLFFSNGIAEVESALRSNSVEMLKLLKSLQTVTRYLHSICCHSKVTSDSLVAAHVPSVRAQCERLTLEVKGMLISNKIPMECITIAILKNKDLDGNDILSQETMEEDSEEDSQLPTEDGDEDSDESSL